MFRHHHHPNHDNTITDDKTLHDATDTMKKHRIKRVVVVNEQQQIQGIIIRSNLVQALLPRIL